MQTAQRIFSTPDVFPEKLDPRNRKLHCCHMSAESYEQSPFLDHRIIRSDDATEALDLDLLLTATPDSAPLPTNYVFHNAFCCSTLFSRYLNAATNTLVLREPNILLEVATLCRYSGTSMLPGLDPQIANQIFSLTGHLLSRRFPGQKQVIIKPSDACNNLMARLMGQNPENKCILIHSELERFIVAILKLPQRKEWIKIRGNELFTDELKETGKVPAAPENMDSARIAACVWILQMKMMRKLIHRFGPDRVAIIDSETFTESPAEVTRASLSFLGQSITDSDIRTQISRVGRLHSKAAGEEYSRERREAEFRKLRIEHTATVDAGLEWATGHFGQAATTSPGGSLPGL